MSKMQRKTVAVPVKPPARPSEHFVDGTRLSVGKGEKTMGWYERYYRRMKVKQTAIVLPVAEIIAGRLTVERK